jgi:hypothetical protein
MLKVVGLAVHARLDSMLHVARCNMSAGKTALMENVSCGVRLDRMEPFPSVGLQGKYVERLNLEKTLARELSR